MLTNCKQCFIMQYQPHSHPSTITLGLCSSVLSAADPISRYMVVARTCQPKRAGSLIKVTHFTCTWFPLENTQPGASTWGPYICLPSWVHRVAPVGTGGQHCSPWCAGWEPWQLLLNGGGSHNILPTSSIESHYQCPSYLVETCANFTGSCHTIYKRPLVTLWQCNTIDPHTFPVTVSLLLGTTAFSNCTKGSVSHVCQSQSAACCDCE